MTTHSTLGASIAARWMGCPGSVRLAEQFPDVSGSSEYAREGTAAHRLAQLWLLSGYPEGIETLLVEGHSIFVTEEMREAVRLYVDTVRATHAAVGGALHVEQRLQLRGMDTEVDMFGTCDAVIVTGRELHVFDLKYGKGVVVDVRNNPQLRYYALAAMQNLCDHEPERITITIVQPRAEHPDGTVRTEELTAGQLRVFGLDLRRAALRTQDPDAPLVPGSWCRFCPAQAHCPALLKHSQALAQVEFDAMPLDRPPTPDTLPMSVVTDILSKAYIIEEWINALRARAQRELEAGNDVPGYKLVPKRATRRWNADEDTVVRELMHLFPDVTEEELYTRALKSPAQMEKLVGKKNLPDDLVVAVSSGLTLVRESDPRPAAAVGAAHEFAALTPGASDPE